MNQEKQKAEQLARKKVKEEAAAASTAGAPTASTTAPTSAAAASPAPESKESKPKAQVEKKEQAPSTAAGAISNEYEVLQTYRGTDLVGAFLLNVPVLPVCPVPISLVSSIHCAN